MSDRCTLWITLAKKDLKKHEDNEAVLEFLEAGELDFEDDDIIEYRLDDIRYPDEECAIFMALGIPYESVNSAGEYPEGKCVYFGGTHHYVMLYDGDVLCRVGKDGIPDVQNMENIRRYLMSEKWFEQYCKERANEPQ